MFIYYSHCLQDGEYLTLPASSSLRVLRQVRDELSSLRTSPEATSSPGAGTGSAAIVSTGATNTLAGTAATSPGAGTNPAAIANTGVGNTPAGTATANTGVGITQAATANPGVDTTQTPAPSIGVGSTLSNAGDDTSLKFLLPLQLDKWQNLADMIWVLCSEHLCLHVCDVLSLLLY